MRYGDQPARPAVIFGVSFTGVVTFWSAGAELLLGVTADRAVGSPVNDLADWHLTKQHADTYEHIGVGGVWVYRNLVTTRAGVTVGLATTASIGLGPDGQKEVILFSERTEARPVEPHIRAPYIRSIGVPSELVFFCGPDGIVRYAGSAITPMTGYLERDVVGRNVLSFIHPEDHAAWSTACRAALGEPGTVFVVVVRVRFTDGSWHWVNERITNLLDDEDLAALVINSNDLTPAQPRHGLPALAALTARESEILNRLLLGDRVPAVAEALFISQSTVRNLLSSIYAKVGVNSQQELIALLRSNPTP